MKPQKGQLVEIRFINGIFFDATVEDWSDQKSIVKLQTGEVVILQNTLQNVLLVKIYNNENNNSNNLDNSNNSDNLKDLKIEKKSNKINYNKDVLEEEFNSLVNEPKTDLNIKRLSELKDELNKMEREDILKSVKSLKSSGITTVQYGIPRNLQISRTAQHTPKEILQSSSDIDAALQNLFSKRN